MKTFRLIVHYGLLLIIILYVLTGLGITRYQIIGPLTFGWLTKPLSFKIHDGLLIPMIIFLLLHLYITMKKYFSRFRSAK